MTEPHPRNDPRRRCAPVAEWPPLWREARERALHGGGSYIRRSPALRWRPATLRGVDSGVGRLLTYLNQSGRPFDDRGEFADILTPELVLDYLDHLEVEIGNSDQAILSRVTQLKLAARAFAPRRDSSWLVEFERAIRDRGVEPHRDKVAVTRHSAELDAFGRRLMRSAEADAERTELARALLFRDGLLVAAQAGLFLRRRNLAGLVLDATLLRRGGTWQVCFPAEQMKGKRRFEKPWPGRLVPELEHYLERWRPILAARGAAPTDALWVSMDGTAMQEISVYFRFYKLTGKKFGRPIPPHAFRYAFATSQSIDDPEAIGALPILLGHASEAVSQAHYNQAGTLAASRRLVEHVRARRRQLRRRQRARPAIDMDGRT